MKINTKVVFEWNDKSEQYEEISCESYDYAGEIALCQEDVDAEEELGRLEQDIEDYKKAWQKAAINRDTASYKHYQSLLSTAQTKQKALVTKIKEHKAAKLRRETLGEKQAAELAAAELEAAQAEASRIIEQERQANQALIDNKKEESGSGGLLGAGEGGQSLNPDILEEKSEFEINEEALEPTGHTVNISTDTSGAIEEQRIKSGTDVPESDATEISGTADAENPESESDAFGVVVTDKQISSEPEFDASGEKSETGEKKTWGGLLGMGKDTKIGKSIGKSIGAFGKKGGLLGMAMKGMGVEGAGDIMNQFTGAMSGVMGDNKQEPLNQEDYISDVQSAANVSTPTYQRQEGSFY